MTHKPFDFFGIEITPAFYFFLIVAVIVLFIGGKFAIILAFILFAIVIILGIVYLYNHIGLDTRIDKGI